VTVLDQVPVVAAGETGSGDGTAVADCDACPPQCAVLPRDRIRRRVLLRNDRGDRYAFAVSWWGRDAYASFMRDTSAPIGATMATARLAVFREIFAVSRGTAPSLHGLLGIGEDGSGTAPELWCRHYMMWANGQPLCLICEVFSPTLQTWMGPVAPTAALPLAADSGCGVAMMCACPPPRCNGKGDVDSVGDGSGDDGACEEVKLSAGTATAAADEVVAAGQPLPAMAR